MPTLIVESSITAQALVFLVIRFDGPRQLGSLTAFLVAVLTPITISMLRGGVAVVLVVGQTRVPRVASSSVWRQTRNHRF